MSGSLQITPWGPAESVQHGDGDRGRGEPPVLSEQRVEAVEGLCPASRHIHQKNCQTIVCFLLISCEYCCRTRPAEVHSQHFSFHAADPGGE